jgi:predicted nucleic acid-binding protein
MTYVFDTNILLHFIRETPLKHEVINRFDPFGEGNDTWISVVTIGELRSIAMQNKWGEYKLASTANYISKIMISDLNIETLLNFYAEIDAFSQGKHPTLTSNFSARKMGKNDLWIAATASLLEATLLTTDSDFGHLEDVFLVQIVNPTFPTG